LKNKIIKGGQRKMLVIETDAKGNFFFEVSNVRLTWISKQSRAAEKKKDWAGGPCIRIQAYKDPTNSKALFQGPEIDLEVDEEGIVGKMVLGIGVLFAKARAL
jgi:hypothetical protein